MTESTPPSAWVRDMLAEQRVSRVQAQPGRAGDLLTQARHHIDSAQTIAADDPTLAVAACHDAIRKAIDAHAGGRGLRVENAPGHHRTVLEYARHELAGIVEPAAVEEADRLRRRRHSTEYGELPAGALGTAEIDRYIDTARTVVRAITAEVAGY